MGPMDFHFYDSTTYKPPQLADASLESESMTESSQEAAKGVEDTVDFTGPKAEDGIRSYFKQRFRK